MAQRQLEYLRNINPLLVQDSKILNIINHKGVDNFISIVKEKEIEIDISILPALLAELENEYGLSENIRIKDMEDAALDYFKFTGSETPEQRNSIKTTAFSIYEDNSIFAGKLSRENKDAAKAFMYLNLVKTKLIDIFTYDKNITLRDFLYHYLHVKFAKEDIFKISENLNKISSVNSLSFPALDLLRITDYAQRFAINYNPSFPVFDNDCTNFCSQALSYGNLPMIYDSRYKTANGIVEAGKQWFYVKNNSPLGYAISTVFIRVDGLWDYLSPHYINMAGANWSFMMSYLHQGFIIQGGDMLGRYSHSVIITEYNDNLCYCGHSSNRLNMPIEYFRDNFNRYRIIKVSNPK